MFLNSIKQQDNNCTKTNYQIGSPFHLAYLFWSTERRQGFKWSVFSLFNAFHMSPCTLLLWSPVTTAIFFSACALKFISGVTTQNLSYIWLLVTQTLSFSSKCNAHHTTTKHWIPLHINLCCLFANLGHTCCVSVKCRWSETPSWESGTLSGGSSDWDSETRRFRDDWDPSITCCSAVTGTEPLSSDRPVIGCCHCFSFRYNEKYEYLNPKSVKISLNLNHAMC